MDNRTPDQRKRIMKSVKNKDSEIEILLRKALWKRGIRYRKNVGSVYGCPDIAFKGKKIAVFCDSEFWHGYDWNNRKKDFKSNCDFWIPKIERNMNRDIEVNNKLTACGWMVLRFWGKEIKKNPDLCADRIQRALEERDDKV